MACILSDKTYFSDFSGFGARCLTSGLVCTASALYYVYIASCGSFDVIGPIIP